MNMTRWQYDLPNRLSNNILHHVRADLLVFQHKSVRWRMSKYFARKSTADGITFDSKKERDRYLQLKQLKQAGEIKDLVLQPRYDFIHNGIKLGFYKADFKYLDCQSGNEIIEDVKGFITPMYRLKKKMMRAYHNIEVIET